MSMPTVRLNEVAKIDRDGVVPQQISDGSLYVGLEHIESGGRLINVGTVSNGDLASTKFRFGPRHILYGKLRPYLAKIALPDFTGVCSTDILPLLPSDRLDRTYLAYFLRQPRMVEYASSRSEGANLPRLSPKALADFQIPLPPLPEQRRIGAILDQAEELRQKRRRSIQLLDGLPQALFAKTFGDVASNPFGFEAAVLGNIIEFIGGSQPPKSNFLYEDGPDRVRFVQIRDFRTDEYKTYVPTSLAKRPFNKVDVMIGRYGPPVFQIFRGLSGTYNVALMKATPKEGIINDFIFYLLQEPTLHSYVVTNSERTAGQSGVNLRLLENYPAFRPPLHLQTGFSEQVREIEAQREKLQHQASRLDALFASLQQRAFSGELTTKQAERELEMVG